MKHFDTGYLKQLYIPDKHSHKGENGKLLVIGGSMLFHSASLWTLKIASRIVDMVFYSSVPENNAIVKICKEEFRDGIVVPRSKIDSYIAEADCIVIGPGLPRKEGQEKGDDDTKTLTVSLLSKYPQKKWVIDGGSLQVIDPSVIPQGSIITPHKGEFELLKFKIQNSKFKIAIQKLKLEEQISLFSKEYKCTILLKGSTDFVCSPTQCVAIEGGNPGMTKGGTGDVLAGLVGALNCKNDPFLSAVCGSFINKKAGDSLYQKVGFYFNASDLVDEIPRVMKDLLL